MLCNMGETCTEHTLRQHFDQKGLCETVPNVCKKWPTFQREKTTNQKYGKLTPKQAETNPWYTLCVYLIVPYKIPCKWKKLFKLCCHTMINPGTAGPRWHKYSIKWLQKFQIVPRKLGLLVNPFHSELCLVVEPNLWLNLPRYVKTTMA